MRSQSVNLIGIVAFIYFDENMLCAFWLSFISPVDYMRYLPLYSLAYLVVPNTEEQFSQPFLSLSKIWQLFQDPIIIKDPEIS